MSVGGEIARGAKALEFCAQPCEMAVRGVGDMNVRQRQPFLEPLHDVRDGERPLNNFAVRGDAHKAEHRGPL